jgi:penicillin-binding protein 1B
VTLALLLTCASLIFRQRQTVWDLIHHPAATQTGTLVYSRWVDLLPGNPMTLQYLRAFLETLGYQAVDGAPGAAGQYAVRGSEIDVYTRPFQYPDQSLPAQRLRLSFGSHQLKTVESLDSGRALRSWRLEPKRLAQWAPVNAAPHPLIRLTDLPDYLPKAVIAVEDKRFYQHGALDAIGVLRAGWVDLRQGRIRQGGSTLSQQLARSVFLNTRRSLMRKTLETMLALYLEVRFSKAQLLEMYLNQVYWGQDGSQSLLGVESASQALFGRSAKELTLGESALLAGTLQSPNRLSPRSFPQAAIARRQIVLGMMRAQELISDVQYQQASTEVLSLKPLAPAGNEAPYFLATLQDTLAQRYALPILLSQGWRIYTTLDPVMQHNAVAALHPAAGQAALVALDVRSGAIRAWVGGTDYAKSPFDRVVYAKRQPGSAFKPFVALAAIDSNQATLATLLEDKPLSLKTPEGGWSPRNYDHFYRGIVSVWDAVVQSINVPMVRLALKTGLNKVVEIAQRAGIESPLRAVPSLALGTSEVSDLELTGAYAALGNGGFYEAPYSIESVVDSGGKIVESHAPGARFVARPGSAFIVTQMLKAVLTQGTARQSRQLGFTFSAAGKTGTSEKYQDAWFVGYTPNLACGVWVGYDRPLPLGHAAAGIALPIWVSFMQKTLSLLPPEDFAEPKELIWKTVDTDTGQLARSGCPHRRKEAFLPGTVPEVCKAHPGGLFGFFYRLRS